MREINLARLVASVACAAACSFVALFFVGCDLGTYGERVQSSGGTLPVTTVSQPADLGSAKTSRANSDSKTGGSNDRDSEADSRDSAQRSQREDGGKKKATSLADIKEKTDARRAQQSEADARARESGGSEEN